MLGPTRLGREYFRKTSRFRCHTRTARHVGHVCVMENPNSLNPQIAPVCVRSRTGRQITQI